MERADLQQNLKQESLSSAKQFYITCICVSRGFTVRWSQFCRCIYHQHTYIVNRYDGTFSFLDEAFGYGVQGFASILDFFWILIVRAESGSFQFFSPDKFFVFVMFKFGYYGSRLCAVWFGVANAVNTVKSDPFDSV